MIAITRAVSRSISQGEVTHIERVPLSYERAVMQHAQYVAALTDLGCRVVQLPALDEHPDAVFVEDTAVVLEDMAVITRPGAESRRGEVDSVAEALRQFRPLVLIEAPATIDGGDVLYLRNRFYVGLTTRTNGAALQQLARLTGREVIGIPVRGALHLKTAMTPVAEDLLLVEAQHIDVAPFADFRVLETDPSEPFSGNALLIGDRVIYPNHFPRTRERLEAAGITIVGVDADELAKVEGGVTCSSLIVI